MYLLAQSTPSNILLYNLANLRLRQRNGTLTKRSTTLIDDGTLQLKRAYSKIFAGIDKGTREQITRSAIVFQRTQKKRPLGLLFLDVSINSQPTSLPPTITIQFRQFHARAKKTGLGSASKDESTTGEEKKFSFRTYFGDLIGKEKSGKEKAALRAYEQYQSELGKLNDSAKNAYKDGFIKALYLNGFTHSKESPKGPSVGVVIFLRVLTITVLFLFLYMIYGKTFRMVSNLMVEDLFTMERDVNVTFDDVCGIDEAKLEVREIVDYLVDPERFTRLGARLPKGVLLVGPPGTGKTLLARAIAGEATVPFFHASGSDFEEMLVGQGARRVRELFKKAKQHSPCVIFIDEIDSVGSKRTSSTLHPYANQTVNQLLNEMDGFVQNEGVIVIGATNKKENLDPALLRPGRFDVQVQVPLPDLGGRKEIFQLYLGKIVHAECDISKLARGTIGFSGADIENMVNQAALKAASEAASYVTLRHLDEARDRILMGPARLKGRHPDEEENRNTAFHEAGHAIVAIYTKHANPLHKVTIIPRGESLGHTSQLPKKDQLQLSKAQIMAELDVAMGGRVAEELVFGQENVTTGSASDLKKATSIAERMVKTFGMSDRVGLRDFNASTSETEMGAFGRGQRANDEIDDEIKRLLHESYERAREILTKYKNEHRLLAEALLEYETLTKSDVEQVIRGERLNVKMPSPAAVTKPVTGRRRKQPPIGSGLFTDRD